MVDKVEEIPVLPIENGRGRYATPKIQSTQQLMNELAKGRKSGEEKSWFTFENVEKNLGIINQ